MAVLFCQQNLFDFVGFSFFFLCHNCVVLKKSSIKLLCCHANIYHIINI
nr:MAG TPA: hypothetical protein [Caudoviricetes sp.]